MGRTKQPQFAESRIDGGVLLLDITEPELHGDEPMAAFGRELLAIVDQFGVWNVVLNFTRVRYLTSAAFEPLTSLLHHVRDGGGRLILCGLSPLVGEVFEVTELIGIGSTPGLFEVRRDIPTAVAAFRERVSV